MKTDYKILWIDDDHQYVRGDKRILTNFLDGHGVSLSIIEIEVTADICPTEDPKFSELVADIDLDMVFVDFNMPENGDKIIKHIRKNLHHYYLPILFYTGNDDAQNSLQSSILAVNDSETDAFSVADGIYFSDRDHISEKAQLILTSLLTKEGRPQQGRGLLMDRVSEIDARMIQSIETLWPKVPEANRDKVLSELQDRIGSRVKSATSMHKKLEGLNYDQAFVFLTDQDRANLLRLDTFGRAKILREILRYVKGLQIEGDLLSEFCNGKACLNALRNEYAHQTEEQIAPAHNDARRKYIRTETRSHLKNIRDVVAKAGV